MSEPDGITLEDLLTPEFVADLAYGVYVNYNRCSTRVFIDQGLQMGKPAHLHRYP